MSRTSASASVLRDGVILNNRYRIIKQTGWGDCGTTYLAEDIYRYRELCVLQEFASGIESDRELQRAEQSFEQNAGILYRIGHPQIPRLEMLLKTIVDGKLSLFLIQQYIEGETYWQLLERRGKLSEAEAIATIWELLAILDYIHASKLIHGNISPKNLILRDLDHKIALINFSCIKAAGNAISQQTKHPTALIADPDYCPDEQIRYGRATICSDLFSLAVTVLVLLSGKPPSDLYDSHRQQWDWSQIKVGLGLKKVLSKMLAPRPCDRYQSADGARRALYQAQKSPVNRLVFRFRAVFHSTPELIDTDYATTIPSCLESGTKNIARSTRQLSASVDIDNIKPWQWGLICAGVLFIPGLITFAIIQSQVAVPLASKPDLSTLKIADEQSLQQKIQQNIELLQIDAGSFYRQVDSIFYRRYPELKGIPLTNSQEHQAYRQIWYQIASNLLRDWENSQ